MNMYLVKLVETEEGKEYKRRAVVSAYGRDQVSEKMRVYYEEALRGMGIAYRIQAIYRITFDVGDIAWLSRVMQA